MLDRKKLPKKSPPPAMADFTNLKTCDTADMSWPGVTHIKVAIPEPLFEVLLGNGRVNTALAMINNGNAPQWRRVSFRASLKGLWFMAYRSKEVSGRPFTCENAVGYQGHPCGFFVGFFPDGSECWAECNKNSVNGPYWVSFSIEAIIVNP